MKNVLLLVHDDGGEEARLQAALDLTRVLSGHLICLDIVQPPALVGAEMMTTDLEIELLERSRAEEASNLARIKQRLGSENIPWSCLTATGDIGHLLADRSLFADIIVLNIGHADLKSPDMCAITSDVVRNTRRPVLAVPRSGHSFDPAGHALIAWNGSAAIIETMRSAMPLLALASGVTLLEIGKPGRSPIDDAAVYLSRHGISARIEHVEHNEVATALLGECRRRQPAYCLVGAYGHSRLRETLFGGVTRRLLAESPVPLLIGH